MSDENGGIPPGSQWWRCDRYEVISDTHIGPAENAELIRYDPFQGHEEYWGHGSRDEEPPYVALTRVDPDDPDEIRAWCSDFGLLGILPHRTVEVSFWPRWGGLRSKPGTGLGGGPGIGALSDSVGSQQQIVRQPYFRWGLGGGRGHAVAALNTSLHRSSTHQPSATEEPQEGEDPPEADGGAERPSSMRPLNFADPLSPEKLNQVQGRSSGRGRAIVQPGARILPIHGPGLRHLSVARGYAQFFPRRSGVAAWASEWHSPGLGRTWTSEQPGGLSEREQLELEQGTYPLPDEETFLREYAEPLPLLQRYIRQVRALLGIWEDAAEATSESELRGVLDRQSVIRGSATETVFPFAEFRSSLRRVSPNAVPQWPEGSDERPAWPRSWHMPSLYAGLNLLIYQDFTQRGVMAKRCRTCRQVFVTPRGDRKYCSERCGNRYRVRDYRGKDDPSDA